MPGTQNYVYTTATVPVTNVNGTTGFTTNAYTWEAVDGSFTCSARSVRDIVNDELETHSRKIYKLINSLVNLSVTEDEFIELLKETEE